MFDETVVTVSSCYFPDRLNMSGVLDIFYKWWTIVNFKQQFQPNELGNALVKETNNRVLQSFSRLGQKLKPAQKSSAFAFTIWSHLMLMREILENDYEFILKSKF